MKRIFFVIFRKLAGIFSGHGWRDRFRFVDRVYKKINQGLVPSVITDPHGHTMYLDKADSMGLALNGVYEPVETRLIGQCVQPGMTVLDIGANIGYYSLLLARLVGPEGHVYAFEPDPYSFGLLSKNIAANQYTNVSAYPLAVSHNDAELRLYRDPFNNLDHRTLPNDKTVETELIKAVRLDDFLDKLAVQSVDFIKMDIQGFDGWALEGMKNLIRHSNRLILLTEFWPVGLDQSKFGAVNFLQQLTDLGLEIIDLNGDEGFVSNTVEELALKYTKGFAGHTNLLCRFPDSPNVNH